MRYLGRKGKFVSYKNSSNRCGWQTKDYPHKSVFGIQVELPWFVNSALFRERTAQRQHRITSSLAIIYWVVYSSRNGYRGAPKKCKQTSSCWKHFHPNKVSQSFPSKPRHWTMPTTHIKWDERWCCIYSSWNKGNSTKLFNNLFWHYKKKSDVWFFAVIDNFFFETNF